MEIRYSDQVPIVEPHPKSIFLAGPTPRSKDVQSWRPEAVRLLREECLFDGLVCVPEPEDGRTQPDYYRQIRWELACLENCAKIVFWVPRDMENMPGLTTNVEFGYWLAKTPDRVVLGFPKWAKSMNYLSHLFYRDTRRACQQDLYSTLYRAVYEINKQ